MASREKMINRKLFMMPDSLEARIRDFRFTRRYPTEAEAIRHLIERGLESEGWSGSGKKKVGGWSALPRRSPADEPR